MAAEVGITERAAHRVISNLVDEGYLDRTRVGRRVEYQLNLYKLHEEPDDRARVVRKLVALLRVDLSPADQNGAIEAAAVRSVI
jgi:DNA-binding transcriptional regulator PaaX